jgi:hypothetical protein
MTIPAPTACGCLLRAVQVHDLKRLIVQSPTDFRTIVRPMRWALTRPSASVAFCATGRELLRTQRRDRGSHGRRIPFGASGIAVSIGDQDGGQEQECAHRDFVFHCLPRRLRPTIYEYTPAMSNPAQPRPSVIVLRDGLVLLGRRSAACGHESVRRVVFPEECNR